MPPFAFGIEVCWKNSFPCYKAPVFPHINASFCVRSKREFLKKIGATEWVSPFVPLCWLLSKSKVRAFSAATTCHNKTGITFGGGLEKGAGVEGVADEKHYASVQNPLIFQKMWR